MPAVYLSTAYLAPIRYYSKLAHFDEVSMEVWENYPKQTYRNRCLIATANGPQVLTVPVEKPETLKCPTRDIRISNHGNWRHSHWNALVSAYNMSPFFEYYADDFRPFYENRYKYLIEYNEALRVMICALLDIRPAVAHTGKYEPEVPNDFRTGIDPRHPKPDESFTIRPYYQVFRDKHGFIPNLSIVDLLFNTG
ncbi:MAG: WbqC family protein, partial [Tannerella sp.]|nr:WbqC family protein [Tannerella sp.]